LANRGEGKPGKTCYDISLGCWDVNRFEHIVQYAIQLSVHGRQLVTLCYQLSIAYTRHDSTRFSFFVFSCCRTQVADCQLLFLNVRHHRVVACADVVFGEGGECLRR